MKRNKKILIISSDQKLQERLQTNLEPRGFLISNAECSEDELCRIIESIGPDLIIVDPEIPGLEGLVCSLISRRWSKAPILIVSAAGADEDTVRGLDLRSPNHLTKPFPIEELMAKIDLILS